ncbi:AAA family ATPase [Bacillus sp. AK031]
MKIIDIHIYGFGKLENLYVKDLRNFSVFYGENEAGKSTIMAFIHGVLFGFPTKQHSEQRYEPKTHAKYGGRLTLAADNGTSFTIERVKGKASGDVTVIYADGSTGGEEDLKRELRGIDKNAYQGIYSFNIHGLQEISKLKEEDINRYLFSSGTTGTDALFKLEGQLQKELDRLFKKTGKKPDINQKLTELRQLEAQLKKAKEKNETYSLLLQSKDRTEDVLAGLQSEITQKEEDLKQTEALLNSWELLNEYENIQEKLEAMKGIGSFPIDGIDRLERWQSNYAQQSTALEVTSSRLAELAEKMEEAKPSQAFIERNALLTKVMEKRELFARWKDKSADHAQLRRQLKAKMSHLMRELSIGDTDEIEGINLDIVTKDRVKSVEENLNRIQMKKESLLEAIQEEKKQFNFLEKRCEELEEKLLEESQYQELQKNIRQANDTDTLKIQYDLVRKQLSEKRDSGSKFKTNGSFLLLSIICGAAAGFLAWSLTDSLLPSVSASIVVLAVITFIVLNVNSKKDSGYWDQLQNQADAIQERIQQQDNKTDERQKALLKEQTELRETWKQWILKLEDSEHTMVKLQENEQNIKKQEQKALEEFDKLAKELALPSDLHWKLLGEAFEKLKELTKLVEEEKNAAEVQHYCREKISLYEKEINEAVDGLPVHFTTIEETLLKIKAAFEDNERKMLSYGQLGNQKEDLSREHDLIKAQLKKSETEISELLAAASSAHEEEFRKKASAIKEKESLEQQEAMLKSRLGQKLMTAYKETKGKQVDIGLVSKQLQETIAALKRKTYKENEKLAEILYELSVLEEGDSYSRLLYRYQEEKAVLNELSREWMKYSLARSALKKTIEEYKKEKLPRVIETAEEYLKILTNGEYTKLMSREDQNFIIKRKDGVIFTPDELSQGTKEQVYIALRFALVRMLRGVYSLPVIIDDGFVNFDKKRTEAVIKLIGQLKDETQVLFFTCHSHILQHIESENLIHLQNGQLRDNLAAAGNIPG